MRFTRVLAAELHKTATLPATWAAIAVALLGSVAITVLNAVSARSAVDAGTPELRFTSPFDTAYAAVPLGTVGAVIIGVVAISSEYTADGAESGGGRQITTTLSAVPGRLRLLAAKALTVALLIIATAAVTIPACVGVAQLVIGDAAAETVTLDEALARSAGAALYWLLTGLIAFAVTVLARNGVIPLIVLIANSSLVSFSLLLTNLTPLAFWLPDMAGRNLFSGLSMVEGGLDAVPGAVVMAAWALGLLAVAGALFTRRDA